MLGLHSQTTLPTSVSFQNSSQPTSSLMSHLMSSPLHQSNPCRAQEGNLGSQIHSLFLVSLNSISLQPFPEGASSAFLKWYSSWPSRQFTIIPNTFANPSWISLLPSPWTQILYLLQGQSQMLLPIPYAHPCSMQGSAGDLVEFKMQC